MMTTTANQPETARPKTLAEQTIAAATVAPASVLPQPFNRLRQAAQNRLSQVPFPTRRQERYKYCQLDGLSNTAFESFQVFPKISADQLAALTLPECQDARLVFVNGRYQPQLSQTKALTAIKGFHITPFSGMDDAAAEALLTQRLEAQVAGDDNWFSLANTALLDDGLHIRVDRDVVVDVPVQLLFVMAGADATPRIAAPRLVAELGPYARLTVMEHYVGLNNASATLNTMGFDVFLDDGASMTTILFQEDHQAGFHFNQRRVQVGRHAGFNQHTLAFSGLLSRFDNHVTVVGEQGDARLNGLLLLNSSRQSHHHLLIDHQAGHSTSNQLYKSIVLDEARGEFDATVKIAKGAQQTNAAQLNKNLVLSPLAKVYTRPQLLIDADDVKCAHGATVGQLDEEEQFYLTSRGLSPAQAQYMLIDGFAQELIDQLPIASLHQRLTGELQDWFNQRFGQQAAE
ncbi:MAG: Fe-S cluster assembly protein SufD [Cyanobacteria bacterium HKST-UBA04]|nr:Fe-S cluster assembly protein SufD [Cyanobacteria bacterium HKST-UBA04]MCA9841567.1 Fe-S cluster assembly protein SufD [Cyanobacteria bacterium HKST-UBA03]